MDNLEAVIPSTETISFNGKDVVIRPFNIGQISKVAKHIGKLARHVNFSDDGDLIKDISALIENADEGLFDVVMLATNTSRPVVEGRDPAEFLDALTAIFVVNKSFFVEKLLPKLQEASSLLTGLGFFSTSSPEATPTTDF